MREIVCYKCKKTGHSKKFCPLNKNNGGSKGAGKDSKKFDGKSEKKTTMEKNGKKYFGWGTYGL